MSVTVVSYSDPRPSINTTSRSTDFGKGLSPFLIGPCKLYADFSAKNVENAWQYCKVYPQLLDDYGNVSLEYFKWANNGWNKDWADRYPMGKGAKPLYLFWNGEKLSYIEARKKVYIPLYAKAVTKTLAYSMLQKRYEKMGSVTLKDFDGYDHRALGLNFEQVISDPDRKMGHAFVLAMLLEGFIHIDSVSGQVVYARS